MRRKIKAARGFGLFELMIVSVIALAGLLVCFKIMSDLFKQSGQAGNGAADLGLATRMLEMYRTDIRQASEAQISPDGASLTLQMFYGTVHYQINKQGRMERVLDQVSTTMGPRVTAASYNLQDISNNARFKLLKAQWLCVANGELRLDTQGKPLPDGRLLVLDTVIRREAAPEEPKQ